MSFQKVWDKDFCYVNSYLHNFDKKEALLENMRTVCGLLNVVLAWL